MTYELNLSGIQFLGDLGTTHLTGPFPGLENFNWMNMPTVRASFFLKAISC